MFRQQFLGLFVFYVVLVPGLFAIPLEENFLLINGLTDEVITMFGPNLNKQFSPCSTFKIPLSLMGYDALILFDEENPIWDFQAGYEDRLEVWKAPKSPLTWMKDSCIWYSKILSIELGLKRIQSYLNDFQYGNQDASAGLIEPGPLSPFWVNSSLKISAKEQLVFIQKTVKNQFSISPWAVQMTKALLFKEDLPEGWKLFGKTGWTGSKGKDAQNLEHSWFVGWIEKDCRYYPFVYLIRGLNINLEKRVPRVKELLMQSDVITRA